MPTFKHQLLSHDCADPADSTVTEHIPDLWQYCLALCGMEEGRAANLLGATLDTALRKRWKKPPSMPLRDWMVRLMHLQFLADRNNGFSPIRVRTRKGPGTFRTALTGSKIPPIVLENTFSRCVH